MPLQDETVHVYFKSHYVGVLKLLIQKIILSTCISMWVQCHAYNKHLFQITSIPCVREEEDLYVYNSDTNGSLQTDLVWYILINALHDHLTAECSISFLVKLEEFTKWSTSEHKGF